MPTAFKETVAITNYKHFPEDLKISFESWVKQGVNEREIQRRLLNHKFTVALWRLREWMAEVPGIEVSKLDDLPEDVKVIVLDAYRLRKPKSQLVEQVASLGYKISDTAVENWFDELFRERQERELEGELEPTGLSVLQEFETRSLTWVFDKVLNLLADTDLHKLEIATPADFEKLVGIVLRSCSVSIARRKMDLEEGSLLNRARAEIKTEVQRRLIGKPHIVTALFEAIDTGVDNLEKSAKASSK